MAQVPDFKKIAAQMNTASPISITQAAWRALFATCYDWFGANLWKITALLGNGTPQDARRLLGLDSLVIQYNNRGDWRPDTDYNTNDLVWWEGSSYGALISHHSGPDFVADLNSGLWRAVGGDMYDQFSNSLGKSQGFPLADYAALRAYTGTESVVFLGGRASPSDGGFGAFYLDPNDIEGADNDGTTLVDSLGRRWKRRFEGPINARWFGAAGGVFSTQAIQAALNVAGSTAWQGSVQETSKKASGMAVYLPPVVGGYLTAGRLLLPPYVSLVGDISGGFLFSADTTNKISAIVPMFDNPLDWALSSANYLADGTLVPYDMQTGGALSDNGHVSTTHGIQVKGISILVPPDRRLFGGLRLQNSPECEVDVFVSGADISTLFNACYQGVANVKSLHVKCGINLAFDNNGFTYNGYCDQIAAAPLPQTAAMFDMFAGSEIPASYSTKTFGVVNRYSFGSSSSAMVTEHSDVGQVLFQTDYSANTVYCEHNADSSLLSVGSRFAVDTITGIGSGMTLRAGENTVCTFADVNQRGVPFSDQISRYNTSISVPYRVGLFRPGIEHRVDKNIVYLSSEGSDDNHGYDSTFPVKTVDEAIKRATIGYRYSDSSINDVAPATVKIVILDAASYTVANISNLYGTRMTIQGVVGTPTVLFDSGYFKLYDASVAFVGVAVRRSATLHSGGEEGGIWSVSGTCGISMYNGALNLAASTSLGYLAYNGSSSTTLTLFNVAISAPASAFLLQSNYADTSPHLTSVVRSGGSFSGGIETRADLGVSAPAAWQIKRVP